MLFLTGPAWASFSVIQTANATGSGTTCNLSVSAVGAGHTLAFAVDSLGGTNFLMTAVATGAGNMILCPISGCHLQDATSKYNVDGGYVLSASGGATTLTATINTTPGGTWRCWVTELAAGGPVSFDLSGTRSALGCATPCSGVTTSPSGTNDAIVQLCVGGPNCTAVTSPYSSHATFLTGEGYAISTNTTSGAAPSWTLTSAPGNMIFLAMGFSEPVTYFKRPLSY